MAMARHVDASDQPESEHDSFPLSCNRVGAVTSGVRISVAGALRAFLSHV
jgi:hypothetical protein